jgi:hypothetical protein
VTKNVLLLCVSKGTLSRSWLHLQSLASTNPQWAGVVGYGSFSFCVIHKEGLFPSNRGIYRLMMMMLIIFIFVQQTEMTWVVAEHQASGAGELSVSKGQQVEVVESWQSRADWWVVRVPGEPPLEGAVPAHVLKPQPQHKTSPSRRPLSQPCEETLGKSL